MLLLSGGVGLPSGLSQNPLVVVSEEGDVESLREKLTLADQKVVSFTDFPSGRSMMNRPSCELSQYPPLTASEVHTYVFCYAHLGQDVVSARKVRTHRHVIYGGCDLPEVLHIPPLVDDHRQLALGRAIECH